MKKVLVCFLVVCLSLALYGCGGQSTETKESDGIAETATTNQLQEAENDTQQEKETAEAKEPEQEPETEAVEIEFLGKEYHPIDVASGNVQEFISLDFKVKNLTSRDIAGVKTSITFLDAFGDKITTINFRFDETIPANGEFLSENTGISYNQFMDDHVKLRDANFEKMSIKYTIDKVVYMDQMEELRAAASKGNDAISMQVTDKVFHPIDVMSGRVSEFLEIDLIVKNNSDKTINAFQGTMKFKDIFGDEIISFNFSDDTTIEPNSEIEITGKGLDYNMFMSDHVKLKSTPFDKLIFEFKVEKILYADGTSA